MRFWLIPNRIVFLIRRFKVNLESLATFNLETLVSELWCLWNWIAPIRTSAVTNQPQQQEFFYDYAITESELKYQSIPYCSRLIDRCRDLQKQTIIECFCRVCIVFRRASIIFMGDVSLDMTDEPHMLYRRCISDTSFKGNKMNASWGPLVAYPHWRQKINEFRRWPKEGYWALRKTTHDYRQSVHLGSNWNGHIWY